MTKPYAIGIDVGGTKIAAGLVDRAGQILQRYSTQAHAQQPPEVVIAAIEQAFTALLAAGDAAKTEIEAVGVGFPGNTNGPAGLVLVSSNLPAWNHFPLRDTLARRLGRPVTLDNDTNLAALGEHRYGAGRGIKNMVYVTLSTGYGAGLILNNRLYVGHSGMAGEVGHAVVELNGPPCTCGKRGCVMAYASGIGLSRLAYEQIEAGAETRLRELAPPDGRRFSGQTIAAAAQAGDEIAAEIIRRAGYYAGVGLSLVVQTLNPELIVVGGGLTHLGARLKEPMLAALQEHAQPQMMAATQVAPWQLGVDLGVIGAAAQAFGQAETRDQRIDEISE